MKKILIALLLFVGLTAQAQTVLTVTGQTLTSTYTAAHASATTFTFTNNSVATTNETGYMLDAGDESAGATNNYLDAAIIRGNKFVHTGTDSGVHGIFTGYNINADIRYNYSKDVYYGVVTKSGSSGTGMTNTGGVIAYNVFNNNFEGVLVRGINNTEIYNNTFYNNATPWYGASVYIQENESAANAPSTGTKIKNNIFYSVLDANVCIKIEDASCTTGFESDYNIFYSAEGDPKFVVGGTLYDFAGWQGLGYDLNSVVVNPNFVNTTYLVPTARLNYGIALSSAWQNGLSTSAVWTVGSAPATTAQNGYWQVGAYVFADVGGGGGPGLPGTAHYVSTTGSNSNPGTFTQPWLTLAYATDASRLVPGDKLVIRGGTYRSTYGNSAGVHLWLADLGSSSLPVIIENYPGEVPIFDLDNITSSSTTTYGVFMNHCSNVTLKGLRITGLAQNATATNVNGIYMINSNNSTLENCVVDYIGGSGIVIDNSTYILQKNCDVHHCVDPETSYENANGFNVTGGVAENSSNYITYEGCRAWKNADDGFDFYGVDSYITIKNCWSFWNGYDDSFAHLGDGQGFKMGPMFHDAFSTTLKRVVINSLAVKNYTNGWDQNTTYPGGSWPGTSIMYFYNNVAYDNGSYGWNFNYNPGIANIFHNNVAFDNDDGQVLLQNSINTYNSWNGVVTATTADFAGVTVSTMSGARQSDGSLPVLPFLHLVSGSDLRGAGVTNTGYTTDGDGSLWLSPPDMGAFQYGASSPVLVTSLTINGTAGVSTITTYHGTLQMLVTSLLPANATNQTVTWSAINGTGSATITSGGLLTASTNGTVTVRATANDGSGIYVSMTVTLSNQTATGYPTVITTIVENVTINSAMSGGNVTSDGGSAISAKGICYSTHANPTLSDTVVSGGTGVGSFSASMTGLSNNTTYHVRAYATNSTGTSFGTDLSFSTRANQIVIW